MSSRAAIALGSNLGDRIHILRRAVFHLGRIGRVAAVSGLYETAPVGGPDQGDYLNAMVTMETELDPEAVLARLHQIEAEEGRRREERWGPRRLDLDLIAMAALEHGADDAHFLERHGELTLPHPRAHERRFVLEPLVELWPEALLANGRSAADNLADTADQEVSLLARDWVELRRGKAWALVGIQFALLGAFLIAAVAGRLPPSWGWIEAIGVGLAAAGGGVGLWASWRLGSALTALPEPRRGTTLVEVGPYRWVRHPIYFGLILGMAGLVLITRSLPALGVAAVTTGFFWIKAGYEESRLLAAVSGYGAYRRRVRGRLFPFGRHSG
ncbi:MAG TPA: 2-amino-4-hydroxy-6-hydroxymethyldihydropteridine diphosphokinase [Acidimicrobiia bacterium]|nr:2-amino-4-hydroxy-6-hydroxymethyldihydropteridine diphosphokinase [Acidimicrobiia bacterium]